MASLLPYQKKILAELTRTHFMPQTDLTHVLFLLDRSGSMGRMRDATIEAFNKFVVDQRAAPGRAVLTMVQFDHEYAPVFASKDVKDVPLLTHDLYQPRGGTALLGAVGRGVDELGKELAALPEAYRPGKVVVAVLTDGEELHSHTNLWSRDYTRDVVRAKLRHQEEAYSWVFTYLSAGLDAVKTAADYGFTSGSTLVFTQSPESVKRAIDRMSVGLCAMRSARSGTAAEYAKSAGGLYGGDTDVDAEAGAAPVKCPQPVSRSSGNRFLKNALESAAKD